MMAKKPTRGLPEAVKVFIVRQLAAFEPPSSVVSMVKAEYGLDVKPQTVECYHPERKAGARLSAKLKAEFYRSRERHLTSVDDIPIAHKAMRLRRLQRLADRAANSGNVVLEASLIEQAAKEAGGVYEGKRQVSGAVAVTGADGGPVEHEHRHTWNAEEEVRKALGALAAEEEYQPR
ncbi:MAG: DUF2280 domain-containing protein [Candidatus Zixiibacteriota bacterium]